MKICPKCSTRWPDTANFWPNDGSDLRPIPAAAVSQPVPVPVAPAPVRQQPTSSPKASPPRPQSSPAPQEDNTKATRELSAEEERLLEQQREHGFSETQWFMAATDPDKLKEAPSTNELIDMQDEYDWDEEISEEERLKFSLRRKK